MLEKIIYVFDKAQSLINKISLPHADKAFHFFLTGTVPFYAGAKLNSYIGKKTGKKLNDYIAGFLSAFLVEGFWEYFIDPRLAYSCVNPKETALDFIASFIGAITGAFIYYKKSKKL
ncbi:hypothetical protein B6U82_00175 [Candidatus Pacearchaeota archaeon ex4484_31]|nr:MAG: hypothetical protein B6U82_00175 [Candidatus Pacearchaeota archaeon ex4484_31]